MPLSSLWFTSHVVNIKGNWIKNLWVPIHEFTSHVVNIKAKTL